MKKPTAREVTGTIRACQCSRCGYGWKSRVTEPKECPSCKRRDWEGKAGGRGRG